jgi:hypothetical protein
VISLGRELAAVSLRKDPGASFTDGGPGGEPGMQAKSGVRMARTAGSPAIGG